MDVARVPQFEVLLQGSVTLASFGAMAPGVRGLGLTRSMRETLPGAPARILADKQQGATMTTEAFAVMARKHWKKWLPRKWKALVASGQAEVAIRTATQTANKEMLELMQAGYPETAAEEVVKAEYILLKPEPETVAPDAEDHAREKAYRKAMR